jgi:serine/threonine protein kinase
MANTHLYPEIGSLIREFMVVDIAGVGGTAIVLKCKHKHTNELKAIKRFFQDKLTKDLAKKAIAESRLNIKSDYLVMAEETFNEKGYLNLIMPFVEGESLRDILDRENSTDLIFTVYTALCLAKAAGDLHKYQIVSTDIKPDNIIVLSNLISKLIDLTCFERIGHKAEVSLGTMPYSPYEIFNRNRLYASTDVYSIGIVMYEMLVGIEEFARISGDLDLAVRRGTRTDVSPVSSICPKVSSIIAKAIEPDPNNRYKTAQELFLALSPYYSSLIGIQPNSADAKKLRLLCGHGKEICIHSGNAIIGRKEIDSRNKSISEEHFEIDYDGNDNAKIRDAGSTNGTYVNGQKVGNNWVQINNSDIIQIPVIQVQGIQIKLRISA